LEVIELKFRLKKGKGAVSEFTDASGVTHVPGEVVDLSASFDGEAWLERVEPLPKVAAVPGKFEPIEPIATAKAEEVPLEASQKKLSQPRKKFES
jgi:hypothetical protein